MFFQFYKGLQPKQHKVGDRRIRFAPKFSRQLESLKSCKSCWSRKSCKSCWSLKSCKSRSLLKNCKLAASHRDRELGGQQFDDQKFSIFDIFWSKHWGKCSKVDRQKTDRDVGPFSRNAEQRFNMVICQSFNLDDHDEDNCFNAY